jgi:probable F420-dependent oxidoreductase
MTLMKFDLELPVQARSPAEAGPLAVEAERHCYDGVWAAEGGHDPFIQIAVAAGVTSDIQLGTGIAVAFARSPMTVAYAANDLQLLSNGRFILGLGSQVRAHIERRFSMPWSHPASRMREYVAALRAIWRSWQEGSTLKFEGEYYRHTLMPAFFRPPPNPFGAPPVMVAAVGPLMTKVAAEVADGVLLHPFTTERYIREVSVPIVDRALVETGRPRDLLQVSCSVLIASGWDDEALEVARRAVRSTVAFYGSTAAYRPVLELHGWGDLQTELAKLARAGRWEEMAAIVSDEVLDAFAVSGPPDAAAEILVRNFGTLADRVSFHAPYEPQPNVMKQIMDTARDTLRTLTS